MFQLVFHGGVRWSGSAFGNRWSSVLSISGASGDGEPSVSTRRNPILSGPAGRFSVFRTQEQFGPLIKRLGPRLYLGVWPAFAFSCVSWAERVPGPSGKSCIQNVGGCLSIQQSLDWLPSWLVCSARERILRSDSDGKEASGDREPSGSRPKKRRFSGLGAGCSIPVTQVQLRPMLSPSGCGSTISPVLSLGSGRLSMSFSVTAVCQLALRSVSSPSRSSFSL